MKKTVLNLSNGVIEVEDIDAVDLSEMQKKPPMHEQITAIRKQVQAHLDNKAQEYGYDSILSASSYAATDNVFQAEGKAFLSWRSACWAHCESLLTSMDVNGIPTAQDIVAGLPEFTK